MRVYSIVALSLVALAAEHAAAFTPNSLNPLSVPTNCKDSIRFDLRLNANSLETGVSEEVTFPYDDAAVRFAYDEWRIMFNKGEFDPIRFENFKSNFRTLTIANLKARKQAEVERKPIPAWMTLNEYGDFSLAEYQAAIGGEQSSSHGHQQPVDSRGEASSGIQASASNSISIQPVVGDGSVFERCLLINMI